MKYTCLVVMTLTGVVGLGLIGLTGCESAEGLDGLTLSPSSVTLTSGGSNTCVFTATLNTTNDVNLALPLVWSVSDAALGSISGSGYTAVYASSGRDGNNTVICRDQYGNEGVASVKQTVDSYELTLAASPGTTFSGTTTSGSISVSGGTAPYQWSVGDSSLGIITSGGHGNTVAYTASRDGVNVISCRDENGVSASIAITRSSSGSGGTGTTTTTTTTTLSPGG